MMQLWVLLVVHDMFNLYNVCGPRSSTPLLHSGRHGREKVYYAMLMLHVRISLAESPKKKSGDPRNLGQSSNGQVNDDLD